MWQCPECERKFAAPNVWHSCIKTTVAEHMKGKSSHVKDLYKTLLEKLARIEKITEDPVKSVILLAWRTKFCAIKLQQQAMKVQLTLPRKIKSKRVERYFHHSTAHHHQITVREKKDIDSQLISWFEEAYALGK